MSRLTELPQTDIVYSYVQPSTKMAEALLASGARGIVFAGTGDGLLSTGEREALKPIVAMPAAARPVLVRSNRTGNGRVASRDDYDALGMIPADTLNPPKARILLMLALTKTHDLDEIRRMFAEY